MRKNAKLPKVLGKSIQRARKRIEITQDALAERVKISTTYMGFIEQGRYVPSLEVLEKIARVLKVRLSDLLG